jgi:hypothetical protein
VAGDDGRSNDHCDEQRRAGVSEKRMKVSLTCSTMARIRVSRRAHVGSGDQRCMVITESLGVVSRVRAVSTDVSRLSTGAADKWALVPFHIFKDF